MVNKYFAFVCLILIGCSTYEVEQITYQDMAACWKNGNDEKLLYLAESHLKNNLRKKVYSFIGSDGYLGCSVFGLPADFNHEQYGVRCLESNSGHPDDRCQMAYVEAYNKLLFEQIKSGAIK